MKRRLLLFFSDDRRSFVSLAAARLLPVKRRTHEIDVITRDSHQLRGADDIREPFDQIRGDPCLAHAAVIIPLLHEGNGSSANIPVPHALIIPSPLSDNLYYSRHRKYEPSFIIVILLESMPKCTDTGRSPMLCELPLTVLMKGDKKAHSFFTRSDGISDMFGVS